MGGFHSGRCKSLLSPDQTDAALWPLLFSAVGSPSKLVEGLLEANALQSGACCLLCVDRLEGSEKAQRFSLQIIREALEVPRPFLPCFRLSPGTLAVSTSTQTLFLSLLPLLT